MCSKKYFLLFVLVIFLFAEDLYAIKLPEKALGKPRVFTDKWRSDTWDEVAAKRSWGNDFTSNPWLVHVANNGAVAYESPSSSSKQLMALDFMDDLYVAQHSGDFVLVFYSPVRMNSLDIPASCRKQCVKNRKGYLEEGWVGWVNVDDLLLWSDCPRTKDGVYKKIAVVKNIDNENMSKESMQSAPILYNRESCSGDSVGGCSEFEFYFWYKKSNNGSAALVYKHYRTEDVMKGEKIGWIDNSEYIQWNTRICWEVAFDEGDNEKLNDTARTFQEEKYACVYDISKQRTGTKIDLLRKDPKIPRSPILNYNKDNGVAHMSVIGNSKGSGLTEEKRLWIYEQIAKYEKALSSINIVFVMDATRSMERTFSEMRKALTKVSEYRHGNLTIKYGCVAFRNFEDERTGDLVEICPLTDAGTVIKFLDGVKCKSVSDNVQEAMFYGLDKAAEMFDNSDESNFVILVSDVSSEVKGKYNENSIIEKFAQKRINLVAFQSAWNSKYGYDFGTQVKDIIRGILKKLKCEEKKVSNNGVTHYVQDGFPLRPMAYRIADEQNTSSNVLYSFAVDIINDFINKTESNKERLIKETSGGTGTDIDFSVCKELIERGIISKCEDLKYAIKVQGYSKMWFRVPDAADRRMFKPCLFLAQSELSDLIQDLEQVTSSNSLNRRAELQKQCINMILSYTGQRDIAEKDKRTISKQELQDMIISIEKECGYRFDNDVKMHIYDSEKLSDDDIERVIKRLKEDIVRLKAVQCDKNSYTNNGQDNDNRYYYILLRDMPLVRKLK